MFDLTPPNLQTLHAKPSWLNRANRIDRAACLELRCSDLWPSLSPRERVAASSRPGEGTTSRASRNLSHSNFKFQTSNFTLTRPLLRRVLSLRLQTQLAGHLRSSKSNALKYPLHPSSLPASDLPPPTSSRILALPSDWSQPLTIQRHKLHSKLAQHFFLCPGCVSTSPNRKSAIDNRKSLKLFLPLPTAPEFRDSKTALLWLQSHCPLSLGERVGVRGPTPASLLQTAAQLLDRYSLLFPPRRFLCRHCLGLRYGEVKSLQPKHRPTPDPAYANFTPDRWQRLITLDNLRLSIAGSRHRSNKQRASIDRMMSKYK